MLWLNNFVFIMTPDLWKLHDKVKNGLHPCDHSIAKVNISEQVLYTTAERAKGDAICEAEHTVENLS